MGINDFEVIKTLFTHIFRCGHCKKMKPDYAKAADLLDTSETPIRLFDVDCTDANSKSTCEEHKVNGYPTLKIFSQGADVKNYEGPRDANGIDKYMRVSIHLFNFVSLDSDNKQSYRPKSDQLQ